MTLLLSLTVLVLGLASLCQSQTAMFDQTLLEASLNKNKDGNITVSEVDAFLAMLAGSQPNVTRCIFINQIVDNFLGAPLQLSALYDLIQIDDGRVLSQAELRTAFLGDAARTEITVTVFRSNIDSLTKRVTDILAAPYQSTSGPTYWKYSDFEIQRWADSVDQNSDKVISKEEITVAMRMLDGNGDYAILRCEYVEAMMAYKEHAVIANKVYDVLFKSRDVSWASVDSDFLLLQMDKYGEEGVVTKEEFIQFFTLQNSLASGLAVDADGSVVGDGDSATMARFSLLCVMSSIFAYLTAVNL